MNPTPIYDAILADWHAQHDGRDPGVCPDAAPTKAPKHSTPLLDDVAKHGTGPWDGKRRKALGSAALNLKRKPVSKRATRGQRAQPGVKHPPRKSGS